MNTKFLCIPSWIVNSVKSNKGQIAQVLDHNYIKNILSPSDLAELCYFTEHVAVILDLEGLPPSNDDSVCSGSSFASLIYLWQSLGKGASVQASDVDKINTYIAVNDCERSLRERLFTPDSVDSPDDSFEIIQFDMGIIGVVIHPGAFTPGQSDENRFVLIRTLVRELTRLNPQKEVARTLLMRRYIELLGVRS